MHSSSSERDLQADEYQQVGPLREMSQASVSAY